YITCSDAKNVRHSSLLYRLKYSYRLGPGVSPLAWIWLGNDTAKKEYTDYLKALGVAKRMG
ncbi:MAG TPA: hypothetical protein VFM05_06860, partial [Candidatus Saccharimonadales bacterium]|nr:hypothetical protein [Candidatus Saccharimonadales bacterium]